MSKTKFLTISCLLLLATNLALISIPFFRNKGKKSPKHLIVKKLQLNKEQVTDLEVSINKHQETVQGAGKEIRALKTNLYQRLTDSLPSLPSDSLIQFINTQQKIIEEAHYNHFKEIKAICTPEQLPHFRELVKDLSRLFVPPPMKKRRHAPKQDKN